MELWPQEDINKYGLECDRTPVFDDNLKLLRAVKKNSPFAFLMAGYNSG